jgi:hypothetical protein
LDLPHHFHFTAVGKYLRALDFDLADTLAYTPFQDGEWDGGKVLFLDG